MLPRLTRLQCTPNAPCLHTSTSLRQQRSPEALYLHTPCLRACTAPPELHTFTSTSMHDCIMPSESQSTIPPRRYTFIDPLDLLTLYFYVYVLEACLYNSESPCLRVRPTASRLQRASSAFGSLFPPCSHTYSSLPDIYTSRHPYLRVTTLPARLRTSGPPCLNVYGLHNRSAIPALHTSISPRLYACSAPLELHTSVPPRPCTSIEPTISPGLHVYTAAARLQRSSNRVCDMVGSS